MNLSGFNDQKIQYYRRMTGYGQLYTNYLLAQEYCRSTNFTSVQIPINQCDFTLSDPSQQNCFVIFQSDYLPQSFIKTIQTKTGYILVNSQWMRQVVLSETNCSPNRIIKLPYLQNFDKLNRFKQLKVQKDPNILTFYNIADYKDVKNILALYDAFNQTFAGYQDVELIIKTSNAEFLQTGLFQKSNKFPKITLINKMIPQVELYKLHLLGDVFVSTAHCVGWQIPPFQASYFGKHLMCGYHSAFTQWVDPNQATIFDHMDRTIPLRQYSDGRFLNKDGQSGWRVHFITKQQISRKFLYVYNNIKQLRGKSVDVSKYDIKTIDYWVDCNA